MIPTILLIISFAIAIGYIFHLTFVIEEMGKSIDMKQKIIEQKNDLINERIRDDDNKTSKCSVPLSDQDAFDTIAFWEDE